MKCKKGFDVIPMSSPMGFYMGTVDGDGFPNCRLSTGYAKTKEAALELALDRQHAEENLFCCGGSCFSCSRV